MIVKHDNDSQEVYLIDLQSQRIAINTLGAERYIFATGTLRASSEHFCSVNDKSHNHNDTFD